VTIDPTQLKKRRTVMLAVNLLAVLAALGAMALYLRGEGWALAALVAALGVGFGFQLWFIAGVRGGKGGA
jgi:hypothetical protein